MNCQCMGHWKRLIKISGGTDCYYCINNMTCLIHVSYCVVVIVTIPVILSIIVLPIDFATLSDACYTSCDDTLFMYTYTLYCMALVPVYPIDTIPVCSLRYRMVAYFIYMFTCITSTVFIIYKHETIVDMTR